MEHPGDRHQAGAVQRGIHQLQSGSLAQAGANLAGLDGAVQTFLAVISHIFNQALRNAVLEGHGLCAGENVGFLNFRIDHSGSIVGHLAAVGAIGLVAIVLGGVMGSRDHNAGVGLVIAGGKGQGGNGHEGIINAHLDAIGSQHAGSGFREHIGIDTAVIGDGNQLIAALGLNPVGKALGSLTDHVDIHPVGARAQNAAQAGSAELQCHREPVLDLLILTFDAFQLFGQCRVLKVRFQPAFVIIHVHDKSPFPSFFT